MEKICLEDITKLKYISAPTLSPDGTLLACAVTQSDWEENSYKTDLHLMEVSTGNFRSLSQKGRDGDFLWDDEETLLIETDEEPSKDKKYEIKTSYDRLSIKTGERVRAFSIPGRVGQIKKCGEGLYAVTVEYDKNAPNPLELPEDERLEALDYHVIEEAPLWENGKGYVAGKRQVLYLYDEDGDTLSPVTNPTTEVKSFALSDEAIAIVGRDWQDIITDTFSELYVYDRCTGKMDTIIPKETGKVKWADFIGDQLVYTFSDNKDYGNTQMCDFYVYDMKLKQSRLLCTHGGMAVGGSVLTDVCYGKGTTWKAAGDAVYFIGLEGFERALYSIDLKGTIQKIISFDNGSVEFFDADERTVCVAAAQKDQLIDLYQCTKKEPWNLKRLTEINGDYLNGKYIAQSEYVPFVNSSGIEIDGWVLKPIDYDEKKKYPAMYEIHGGPRAAYGCVFVHEMQALASAGYFVFFCNPRGSEGKGEEFADIRAKHGIIDYEDLMEFMDYILKHYPQIDEKRVAVAGGSYAGFMCNWIAGHTDRFAAIVSQRSVSDFVADYCISDIGFTYDSEAAGGDPWNDTEKLWFHSPYKYAPYAKTPILFLHALCDYHCTIDQGVMMFQAMKYFGVPSRMCLFEGENHELSRTGKPRHRVRRLKEIFHWLEKYLG